MARKLARTVIVRDPESHRYVTVLAGTEVPARIAELITNPAAWGDGSDAPAETAESAPEPAPAPAGEPQDGPPAKSASKADWVAYAVSQGMDEAEADAATKDDLIDALGG